MGEKLSQQKINILLELQKRPDLPLDKRNVVKELLKRSDAFEETIIDRSVRRFKSQEKRIEERGQESFGEAFQKFGEAEGLGQKTMAGLNVATMPFERIEGSIANAALALQDRRFDDFLDDFVSGARGKKLGELGDIFRKHDIPEPISATAGLILTFISPFAAMRRATKAARILTRGTDKGVKIAGKLLIKGSDDAARVVGINVNRAYKPVNKFLVNGDDFIKIFDDMPDDLIKHIEKTIGRNIDDIALNPKISDVREVKRIVGKFNPGLFGQADRGIAVADKIKNEQIVKGYGKLKKIIQRSLEKNGLGKEAKHILAADDAFHKLDNASDFVKAKIVDPKLKQPTRGGQLATAIKKEGDLSAREAIRILRGTKKIVSKDKSRIVRLVGKQATKDVTKALSNLHDFNRTIAQNKLLGGAIKASFYAGLIGSVGAKTARTVLEGAGDFSGGGGTQ